MHKIGYGDEIEANIKGALSARMMEWERDFLSDLFTPPISKERVIVDLPWEELLNRPVVIELDALNRFQANLVSLFVLSQIREHLKKKGQTEELRHIIVIEEAHNLFGNTSQAWTDVR